MRADCYGPQVNYLLLEDKIIAYKKSKDVEERVAPPTGNIPEGLQGQNLSKRKVQEINNRNNQIGHAGDSSICRQR